MRINQKIKELQKLIEEETGAEVDIDLHFHSNNENGYLDFKMANEIANKLQVELGGDKRIWRREDTFGISGEGTKLFNDKARWTVFFLKEVN